MSCKFKKFDEPRFCQVIQGECQFLENGYDDKCPIMHAFIDFDSYCINVAAQEDGTVHIDNIKSIDGENKASSFNINQDI